MVTPAQILRRKRALKPYLVRHGQEQLAKRITLVPIAGPAYRRGIRWLQANEWPNHPTDGIANSNVLAVLFPPKPRPVGAVALKYATGELGTKEHPAGSNRGPRVDQYQAVCGISGEPWCACFVTWSLRQAGWRTKGWNQAYVPAWVATAHLGRGGLRVIAASQVQPGDIACFDWERNGVADHIGFCSSVVRGGEFHTVEGNTAVGNDSNGGEVMSRLRSIGQVACFIRVGA